MHLGSAKEDTLLQNSCFPSYNIDFVLLYLSREVYNLQYTRALDNKFSRLELGCITMCEYEAIFHELIMYATIILPIYHERV